MVPVGACSGFSNSDNRDPSTVRALRTITLSPPQTRSLPSHEPEPNPHAQSSSEAQVPSQRKPAKGARAAHKRLVPSSHSSPTLPRAHRSPPKLRAVLRAHQKKTFQHAAKDSRNGCFYLCIISKLLVTPSEHKPISSINILRF